MRINQKNFIEAFEIYRKAEKEYIVLIIETYAKQNRLAFWED